MNKVNFDPKHSPLLWGLLTEFKDLTSIEVVYSALNSIKNNSVVDFEDGEIDAIFKSLLRNFEWEDMPEDYFKGILKAVEEIDN